MSNIKPVTIPSKRLAASIDASATSLQLNNIKGWDGNDLTSSDLGDVWYVVLRNDANTQIEIMELDPTTVADSSITITRRGLKFDGDDLTTEVTANKLTWVKNETIVELGTNAPQLLGHFVKVINDETVAGKKTFSSLPATTAGDAVADNDLVRKAQLDAATLGQIGTDKVIVAGTAGETIADGDLIYFDSVTNNEWMLCDADTAASVDNVLLGIAQGAGTDGNAITGGVLLQGVDDAQSGLTAGNVMYASNTAGDIASSPGTTEVTIGIAKSTTEIYFNPRLNQQITEDQQDALAGTGGTPSSSNKYVTQSDSSGNFLIPPGVIMPYGGSSAPTGWLLCDGTTGLDSVTDTSLAGLFAIIGTTFGGTGAADFDLPDMRGNFPLGKDNMGGSSRNRVTDTEADTVGSEAGSQTHTLTTDEIPSHSHNQQFNDSGVGGTAFNAENGNDGAGTTSTRGATESTGGGSSHENMPPYMTFNYIIKK